MYYEKNIKEKIFKNILEKTFEILIWNSKLKINN